MFDRASPVWWPDGGRIAFTDYDSAPSTEGGRRINVVNSDGSGFTTVLYLGAADRLVVDDWSDDGRYLLFTRTAPGGMRSDVYLLNLEAGTTLRLSASGLNEGATFWPAPVESEVVRPLPMADASR